MHAFDRYRLLAHKGLIGWLWIQCPLTAYVAYICDAPWALLSGAALAAAATATACWSFAAEGLVPRATIAAAVMVQISLLVAALSGKPWQVDVHMSYFAALALVSVYCDALVIVVAAAVVALHHICLNVLLPAAVYPGGGDFPRVLLHAVILIVEAAGLIYITEIIRRAFLTSEQALHVVQIQQAKAERATLDLTSARAAEREAAAERAAYQDQVAHGQESMAAAIGAELAKVADGDLTARVEAPLQGAYGKLKADLNGAVGKLELALREVSERVGGVRSGTLAISEAAGQLSQRTERQAARLEETAAALEQVTAAVNRSSAGATQARAVVARADGAAKESAIVVSRAVEAMGAITASSSKIGEIIGVIDEIAFQTNLLALNAGVEAARAGDAGRGFAIVASEVRGLAQRSTQAAKQIKDLISASVAQVGTGAKLVNDTGLSLSRIVDSVSEINQVVADIASAAGEQAQAISGINAAVNEMDRWTQQNAAMADEATKASRSLADESSRLDELLRQFQLSAGQVSADDSRGQIERAAPRSLARPPAPPAPAGRPPTATPRPAVARRTANGGDDGSEV